MIFARTVEGKTDVNIDGERSVLTAEAALSVVEVVDQYAHGDRERAAFELEVIMEIARAVWKQRMEASA